MTWTGSLGLRDSCASRVRGDSGIAFVPVAAVASGSFALPTSYSWLSSGCSTACFEAVVSGMRILGLFIYIYCFCNYKYLLAAGITGLGAVWPHGVFNLCCLLLRARSKCVDHFSAASATASPVNVSELSGLPVQRGAASARTVGYSPVRVYSLLGLTPFPYSLSLFRAVCLPRLFGVLGFSGEV